MSALPCRRGRVLGARRRMTAPLMMASQQQHKNNVPYASAAAATTVASCSLSSSASASTMQSVPLCEPVLPASASASASMSLSASNSLSATACDAVAASSLKSRSLHSTPTGIALSKGNKSIRSYFRRSAGEAQLDKESTSAQTAASVDSLSRHLSSDLSAATIRQEQFSAVLHQEDTTQLQLQHPMHTSDSAESESASKSDFLATKNRLNSTMAIAEAHAWDVVDAADPNGRSHTSAPDSAAAAAATAAAPVAPAGRFDEQRCRSNSQSEASESFLPDCEAAMPLLEQSTAQKQRLIDTQSNAIARCQPLSRNSDSSGENAKHHANPLASRPFALRLQAEVEADGVQTQTHRTLVEAAGTEQNCMRRSEAPNTIDKLGVIAPSNEENSDSVRFGIGIAVCGCMQRRSGRITISQ